MNIKDLFSWGKKAISAPFVGLFGARYQGFLGTGRGKQYLQEYRNWVFACVQARAEEVGNIDLKLFKGDEEIEDDELLDLLYRVNPTMTKADLFFGTQAFLDLDGNAFWFLARDNDGKGKIKEIWLLRPDRVKIATQESNPLIVSGYVYEHGGKKVPFNPNEILHFKNFNPMADHPFPHRGLGIVEASIWAIETDNEARQWNYSFFKNSARPDGFLTKEGQGSISDEEYKRLKLQFAQEHQGSGNAHKVGILSGGLKWQEITKSQRDMDFIEQRRFSRDEILALFRTPKTAIGIVEDVNRANAEATNYIFALRTIKPLMQRIIDTINEFLVPEFADDLELDFESPVPADKVAQAGVYTQALDRWMSRNEVRALEGLPPTENGDQIFGSFTLAPIDSVPPQSKKADKPVAKEKKIESKDPVDKIINKFVATKQETSEPPKQLSALAVQNYKEIWIKSFGVHTEPLRKEIDKFLTKQEKEVLKNIDEELKGLESPEFRFKAVSDLLFNKPSAIRTGIALITPNIRRYIAQAGEQAILLTGLADVFDATTPEIQKFIEDRASMFSNTFNDTTAERLLEQLKLGIEDDETSQELSERVSKFYDGERDYRSDRAARTEVSAGSNFAAQEAYSQAGVKEMQWLVVNPEDADCLNNEGEHRAIGEAFPSGDDMPPVHPNCVCTVLPYFG